MAKLFKMKPKKKKKGGGLKIFLMEINNVEILHYCAVFIFQTCNLIDPIKKEDFFIGH